MRSGLPSLRLQESRPGQRSRRIGLRIPPVAGSAASGCYFRALLRGPRGLAPSGQRERLQSQSSRRRLPELRRLE